MFNPLPLVEERARIRSKQLSAGLGNADWLDGAFNAVNNSPLTLQEHWITRNPYAKQWNAFRIDDAHYDK